MFVQYVDSRREIKVNLETLSIYHWNNKCVLRKSDGELVLRGEMEWSQFYMPRVWNKDSSPQSKMRNRHLKDPISIWETKKGVLVWKSV